MTGVAQAADSIDDLASFLGGEPEEAHEGEEDAEHNPSDEDDEEGDQPDESEEESTDEPEQAGRKIKVPVKGEDGQETFEEIEEKELIAGYERQKSFTQKTMALAEKERQAAEIVQQRVTEASQYALQQARAAKQLIAQFAGLKPEDELQRMSVDNPAGWVQEQERVRQVNALWERADAAEKAELGRIDQVKREQEQAQTAAAWAVLTEKGIDRQKLTDLYGNVTKAYGVTGDQLGKVTDAGLVLAMKDALAYRALQDKKPQIAQKVKEAERLPTAKKALPVSERVNKQLNEKFSKGRAKTDDLAAFLYNNRL